MLMQRSTTRLCHPQRSPPREVSPALRFSPTAWAKLLWLRDYGPTEVGGFGLTAAEDLLLVEDIELVRQRCSAVTVAFDDEAVADYFDCQGDLGQSLEEFGRIWIHTHPGSCPEPSSTDEDTFTRVFGRSQWAVMFILARGGDSYARLRFSVGPGCDQLLPVRVDFQCPFVGSNQAAWEAEYHRNVEELPTSRPWFADPWDALGDLVTERDSKRRQSELVSPPEPPF